MSESIWKPELLRPNPGEQIGFMNPSRAEQVYNLYQNVLGSQPNLEGLAMLTGVVLEAGRTSVLGATSLILPSTGSESIIIESHAVVSAQQRNGIGSALLRWAERHGAMYNLPVVQVDATNTSISFYQKQGYVLTDSGKNRLEKRLPGTRIG